MIGFVSDEAFKEGLRSMLLLTQRNGFDGYDIRIRCYIIALGGDPDEDHKDRRFVIDELRDEFKDNHEIFNALQDRMDYEGWLRE